MTADMQAEARAVWLMLRKDGGWWTLAALVHHWHPSFADFELLDVLAALVKGRFLEVRQQLGATQYCFTSSCLELPGAGVPA